MFLYTCFQQIALEYNLVPSLRSPTEYFPLISVSTVVEDTLIETPGSGFVGVFSIESVSRMGTVVRN